MKISLFSRMTGLVALVAVLLMGSADMAYAQETDGNKVSESLSTQQVILSLVSQFS